MIKIDEIKKGDIVFYRNGRINYVNKPEHYEMYFNNEFENTGLYSGFDIIKIQRYKKVLFFYIKKTIYIR